MIMNSVREISKENDVIRTIGRMPDRVLDKDAEDKIYDEIRKLVK